MFPLRSMVKQFKLPCNKSLELFHSLIEPIALYNSENLAHLTHHQIKSIEEKKTSLLNYMITSDIGKIQQKFLKFVLGVKRNCSNLATLGELGEFPLCLNALVSLLSYWHRSTQMQDSTLIKKALQFVSSNDPSQSEWYATVKCLLNELNLHNYLLNPEIITTDKFKQLCKEKIKNLFTQQWGTEILNQNEGCKLRFYKKFKTTFVREPYFEHLNNFQMRKIISKFRCSDHRLEIEVGRHKNIQIKDRVCQLCRGNIETELHFLTECPLYTSLRLKYLGNNANFGWIDSIKCGDKGTAFNFANFLTKALELRSRMLDLYEYFN